MSPQTQVASVEDYAELTVVELKERLDSQDIKYPSNARKQELIDLLEV